MLFREDTKTALLTKNHACVTIIITRKLRCMMGMEDNKNVSCDAVSAAQKYINQKEECRGRHEAYIGISVNGKEFHGVRMVSVDLSDGNPVIIVEDLHTLCSHSTNRFTPDTDDISIINNTLRIKPRGSFCGLSVIEISAK